MLVFLMLAMMLVLLWQYGCSSVAVISCTLVGIGWLVHRSMRGLAPSFIEKLVLLFNIQLEVISAIVAYVQRGFHPKFPEWTFGFEIAQRMIRCVTNRCGHRFVQVPFAAHIRDQSAWIGTLKGMLAAKLHGFHVEPVMVHDMEHLWIRLSTRPSELRNRFVVVYFHGGGYAIQSPRMYMEFGMRLLRNIQNQLCKERGVQVELLLANYRKIPEHRFPVPVQDAVAMFDYASQYTKVAPDHVLLAGDSAGAGLVLSVLLHLRDDPKRSMMPLASVASFPYVDLSDDHEAYPAPNCILSKSFADGIRQTYVPPSMDWKAASAVHCDLHGLGPMLIQSADQDLIFPHALRLHKALQATNNNTVILEVYRNMPHVFHLFPASLVPSSRQCVDAIAAFMVGNITTKAKNA